jgi:branched-chain amino acid transport system substrate-binding protein
MGKQWTQPIGGFYLGYEILADVLRRAGSIDKETIRKALADTNLETIGGPITFSDKNIAITPVGLIQWVKGERFPFESKLVSGGNYPNIKPQGKLMAVGELQKKG